MSTKQQPLPGDIIMEDDLMQNIDKYMNWLQSIDVEKLLFQLSNRSEISSHI